MTILKRVLLFVGALIVLQFGAVTIGSMIAGAIVGAHVPNQDIPRLAFQAGASFTIRYRPIIFALAFVISAFIAFGFRFMTLLFSVPVAILGFLVLQRISILQEARFKAPQLPAPFASATPSTVTPSRIGKRGTLLARVTVKVAYGQTVLPKGTVLTILSESDGLAEVKGPDGSIFSVPLNQIQQ